MHKVRLGFVVVSFAAAAAHAVGCAKPAAPEPPVFESSTSGSEIAPEPAPAAPTPTAAPTEESPGVFTGVVACDRPNVIPVTGTATEVLRFEATLSVPPFAETGANAAVTLVEGDVAQHEGENPVAISGVAYGDAPVTGTREYNFRRSGSFGLRVSVEQCVAVSYRVTVAQAVPPVTNVSKDTAAPISVDAPATGTLGCEEQRWYAFDARGREKLRVTIAGTSRITGSEGRATVQVVGPTGPLVDHGNPVTAETTFDGEGTAPGTRDLTVPRAGHYFLGLSFSDACVLSNYSLTLSRQ